MPISYGDAHMIVPCLWMGSYPPEGSWLAHQGFTMLALVAAEHLGHPSRFPGVRYVSLPLDDGPLSLEEQRVLLPQLDHIASVITHEIRDRGGKVLVACNQGRNRSGLVVAFTLRRLRPRTPARALVGFIRRRRPRDVLTNHWFEELIEGSA